MTIHVGVPIRPAGAERLPSASDIVEKIGPCVAQPKLDGFRLQIHIDNTGNEPKIFFFSRHLVNMSYMFPDLKAAFEKCPFKSVIIEGEAIVYDPATDRFLPFQETAKRKRKHGIEEAVAEFPLRIYLFDLLYLDGVSYLHETHETRRAQLQDVVEQIQHSAVRLVEEQPIVTADDLEQYVHEQLELGLEGVVVKRPQAPYQAGKRNFNWIKLKHEQTQGLLEDTIDAVILGYYAGSGKRAHFGIGAFLVGVYNK
jgi:DNA ligase-1